MSETKARFADALLFELMSNAYEQQQNNVNLDRFPLAATPRARARRALRDLIQGLFGKAGYLLRRDNRTHIELRLSELKKELPALERLAGRLSDDASRELLMRVVAYRTLGPDRVKLPLAIGDRYATQVEEMRRLVCNDETVAGKGTGGWTLNCFDLSSLGFPIRLFATSPGLVCTFTNRQYAYGDAPVRVERGDVVIDAGGCWGETTLYFAHESRSRVFVFEFTPSNLDIMRRNLALNEDIARSCVEIVPHPVWSRSGVDVFCRDEGPGSRVSFQRSSADESVVKTLSIDDLASKKKLERLDFLKMDIEGAEMEALAGAAKSIRRFRPKLAISVYHRPTDLTAIPEYIDSLGVPYDFYLGHYTDPQ